MTVVPVRQYLVSVWLHTSQDPPPHEWTPCLERMRAAKAELNGDVHRLRTLIVTDGGAPNSQQRGQLFTHILECNGIATVITNSLKNPLKRGIAKALTWLNPPFRAFEPEQAVEGFAHIDCDAPADRRALFDALVELQSAMPPVRTLDAIAHQLRLPRPAKHLV